MKKMKKSNDDGGMKVEDNLRRIWEYWRNKMLEKEMKGLE